ncbi:hypothetical protein [Thermosulfurimonas sp. F29]|uniref:hypothetical protein n=1 Tax=Thermosulfurimonas sp. F29 TaxID=2867247 RepID=UPI001C83510D|nr:hypothetical protein [Thermosulfurimonas sp. F29]MBX6423328.1 hypothetical protein [Thermosulfurimonas sp. F29]
MSAEKNGLDIEELLTILGSEGRRRLVQAMRDLDRDRTLLAAGDTVPVGDDGTLLQFVLDRRRARFTLMRIERTETGERCVPLMETSVSLKKLGAILKTDTDKEETHDRLVRRSLLRPRRSVKFRRFSVGG